VTRSHRATVFVQPTWKFKSYLRSHFTSACRACFTLRWTPTRSEKSPWSKRRQTTFWRSATRTEILSATTCAGFTISLNLGWLAWPVLHKAAWPKIRSESKRAITPEEHAAIVASEQNPERRAYYELLYETGAAQTDAANLTSAQIDWRTGVLNYRRQKLGPFSEPARLTIGKKLREILLSLPEKGDLFPTIKRSSANARATEFRRRCRIAGPSGVSLHSYRHSWAQRAKSCGYPQRFAQEALGHTSRAVHEAYAKGACVICPPLDEYEDLGEAKIVTLPTALDPRVNVALQN
jgi:integrase